MTGEQLVVGDSSLGLFLPMLWACGDKGRMKPFQQMPSINSPRPLRKCKEKHLTRNRLLK